MKRGNMRADAALLAALGGALLAGKAWLMHAAGLDLHFDEAQYWEWAQQLDWSYYSKGPLVAWCIAAAQALFGQGEWQVRLFAWLAHAAFLVLIFALTFEVFRNRAAAWWAVIVALATPLYFTLGLVMTTDVWLLVFWTWGLWAAYRALFRDARYAWYEFGAAVGVGALTKLSIVLLPLLVGLGVLLTPRFREHLKNPHLWGGVALALLCVSPLLYWNAAHDWVMFRHELGHVAGGGWSLSRLAEFIGGQALALSPLVLVFAAVALWRMPIIEGERFLWLLSLALIAFFSVKALGAKVQINWAAPSYVGMIVLFGAAITQFSTTQRRLLYSGLLSSVALMSVAYFPYAFGLTAAQDSFRKMRAWETPIREIGRTAPPADFILTSSYVLAGELAFYWPRRLPVYVTGSAERRFNQHDLWPGVEREAGRNGLYIDTTPTPPALLAHAFRRCIPLPPLPARAPDGTVLRTFYVSVCENYQVIEWPKPLTY
ncbi:MAG: glycosyltransferase family 39 protein [Pseudomonadota bacterium]